MIRGRARAVDTGPLVVEGGECADWANRARCKRVVVNVGGVAHAVLARSKMTGWGECARWTDLA